jgi:hypothetical protein
MYLCIGGGHWTKLKAKNPPPPLQDHSLIYQNGKLYMFGGELGLSNQTPLWIYNIQVGIELSAQFDASQKFEFC